MPALDGIRGLAILLVLFHHFVHVDKADSLIARLTRGLADSGWIGVDLFFALSGFLITGILARTKTRKDYFRRFILNRTLRIFPLYFAFIALALLLFPVLFTDREGWGDRLVSEQAWYWTYLVNVGTCFSFDRWPPFGLGHLWSLCVEEHYYLFWPAVVYIASLKNTVRVCIAIVLLSPLIRSGVLLFDPGDWTLGNDLPRGVVANYMFTPLRLDAIAAGGLLRLLFELSVDRQRLLRLTRKVFVLSCVALAGVFVIRGGVMLWNDWAMQVLGYSLLGVAFSTGVLQGATLEARSVVRSVLCSPVLRFFGRYSYSMYVFHLPVHSYLVHQTIAGDSWGLTDSPLLAAAVHFVVAGSITTLIALLTWHTLEKHFLRLKSHA